jgi:hypothetical protein
MPIPSPKNKENKNDFVSRCVSELSKSEEFKTQDQRLAVCYKQFEGAKANAAATVNFENNEFLVFSNEECKNCEEESGTSEEVIDEAEAAEAKKNLNKPFRTPGGPKKFSVYVKNDNGNIVKVNFGDPNMKIRRDNPERRKSYRARHNCDNPGPKWKANYWSCKMWSAKPVSKITGSENDEENIEYVFEEYKNDFREMIVGSIASIKTHCENVLNSLENESVKENLTEPFLQQQIAIAEDYVITMHNYVMFNQIEEEDMEAEAARKGLWENIRKKKERMGKNYKPAQPGSPDRPSGEAWKKAQK